MAYRGSMGAFMNVSEIWNSAIARATMVISMGSPLATSGNTRANSCPVEIMPVQSVEYGPADLFVAIPVHRVRVYACRGSVRRVTGVRQTKRRSVISLITPRG